MRQDSAFFGDEELPLLYVAKKLKEALAVEELLTAAEIDYLVEPDTYRGGVIFPAERIGAFFYVSAVHEDLARQKLIEHRFKPYTI